MYSYELNKPQPTHPHTAPLVDESLLSSKNIPPKTFLLQPRLSSLWEISGRIFCKREFLSVLNILKFPSFAQSPEWYEPQPNKLSLHFHAVITHLDFVKVFPSLTGNPHLNFMNFFLAIFNIAIDLWKRGISLLLAHRRKHEIIQFYFKQTYTYLLKNCKRKYKNKIAT